MPYRISHTTDGQHVGEVLDVVEEGQVVTFSDGDVVPIHRVFAHPSGDEIVVSNPNYQMILVKE